MRLFIIKYKMITGLKHWFIPWAIILCCCTKVKETQLNTGKIPAAQVNEIVLVDVPFINRCEMGRMIHAISSCNPKVIGVNFLFVGEKDQKCDSLLCQSIIASDKVVLIEGFKEGAHVESHRKFIEAAFLSGTTGLSQNNDGVTDHYYRLIDFRGKWEISFPFLIALQYDKNRAAELSSTLTPQDYPIVFYHKQEGFKTISYTDVLKDCSFLSDKLVIVGNLGSQENVFLIRIAKNASDKMPGTVIIANVVLDILKELDKK